MNMVISFSPTNGTKRVADYVASYLDLPLIDISSKGAQEDFDFQVGYEYIVFCFPVYSQNIPLPVKKFITKLKAKYIIYLATYGKMGTGNVINELSMLNDKILIGGAYVPTKHTYKEGDYFNNYHELNSLLDRVTLLNTLAVKIPKLRKHLFANFLPNYRSKYNVRISRNSKCINCSICNDVCPMGSINNGIIAKDCLRCLSCYYHCFYQGLTVKYSQSLKRYLKNDKLSQLIIY